MAESAASTVHIRLRCFFAHSNTPPSASTFFFLHFIGAAASFSSTTSNISRHFHGAFLSLKRCLSYSARLQFMAAFNQLTTSTIAVLTAFLQLKYQGGDDNSPFSTHPTSMCAAVSCSAVYYIVSATALRFPLHPLSLLAHHLSAYMTVASLACVLLSDSATFLVYAVSGFLSAAELLCFYYCKFDYAEVEVERRRGVGVGNSSSRRLPI